MNEIQNTNGENANISREYSGEDLKAGTYWTCIKDVVRDGNELGFNQGEVILLADTPSVDNAVHHVIMMIHPKHWANMGQWDKKQVQLTMHEFWECFEYCANGEQIRAEEIAKIQGKIKNLQDDITDVSTNPQSVMEYLETSADEELKGYRQQLEFRTGLPSPDSDLESAKHTSLMAVQLNNQRVAAEATGAVIQKISSEMTNNISTVGNYYSEVAEASKSKVSGAIAYANDIASKLETLDIYIGKDVDIEPIIEGASASSDKKFNVFQNLIYMDEESLINHAHGGADFTNITDFFKKLKEDKKLRNRIFPMERTIVAIRPRRDSKRYGDCPITNTLYNQLNAECFIMVRNGENIHAIYSPMKATPHLFPTRNQMDRPFTGLDGRNITKEDLDYVNSREKSEHLSTHYKRLLLLIQGVYERDYEGKVFGELPEERDGKVLLLNPKMQERCFNFISEENQISDSRPDYKTWFNEVNAKVVFGSRILVDRNAINMKNCGGIYNNPMHYSPELVVDLNDSQFLTPFIIKKNKGKMMFQVKGVSTGYNSKGLERNYWVDFEALMKENHNSHPDFICLDNIYSGDIEFYINSRNNRRHYRNYIDVLLRAENEIKAFEANNREVFDSASAIIKGKFDSINTKSLWQAISSCCSSKGGENLNLNTDVEKVLNVYWQETTDMSSVISEIGQISSEIIAISTNDRGEYFAYYTMTESSEVEIYGFEWLVKAKVIFEGSRPRNLDDKTKVIRASEIDVSEKIIYGEEELNDLQNKQDSAHRLTFRQYKNRIKQIKEALVESESNFIQPILDLKKSIEDKDLDPNDVIRSAIKNWKSLRYKVMTNNNTIDVPVINYPLGLVQRGNGRIFTLCATLEYDDVIRNMILENEDAVDSEALIKELHSMVYNYTNTAYSNTVVSGETPKPANLTLAPIELPFKSVLNHYADHDKIVYMLTEESFENATGRIDKFKFSNKALSALKELSKYYKISLDGRGGNNFDVNELLCP